jgi:hypothetical protein
MFITKVMLMRDWWVFLTSEYPEIASAERSFTVIGAELGN